MERKDMANRNKRNKCPSGKKAFESLRGAHRAIGAIAGDPNTVEKPTRVYKCDLCRYWHLTKKEKE